MTQPDEDVAADQPPADLKVPRIARMVIGFGCAALAVVYLAGAAQFRWGTLSNPGPALFPGLLGVAMFFVGLAAGIEGILKRHIGDGEGGSIGGKRFAVAVGALLLFVAGVPFLGFTVMSMSLMLVMQHLYGSDFAWWKRLLIAVVTVLAIELFMTALFGFHFPGGLVGMLL